MIQIDFPFRRDMFAPIAIVWVAACTIAWVLGMLVHQSTWSVVFLAAITLIVVAVEYEQARRLGRARAKLSRQRCTLSWLADWVRRHPQEVYLGIGFDWGIEQARAAWLLYHTTERHHLVTDNKEDSITSWMRLLGPEKPLALPLELFHNHLALPGTTQSGKTVFLALYAAQAILRGEVVIVLAPKDDPNLEARCRKATALADGDFYFVHLGLPEESVRINPLQNFSQGTEIASRIAQLIPSETGGDPFKAFCFMATAQILLAQIESGERPTLRSLKSNLENGVDELVVRVISSWCNRVRPGWERAAGPVLRAHGDPTERARALAQWYLRNVPYDQQNSDLNGLIAQMNHDRQHFDKMITSLMPLLTALTAGELGELLSPSTTRDDKYAREILDVAQVCNRGGCLYLALDTLPNRDVGQAVGAIICAELASIAGDRQKEMRERDPENFPIVNVLIDEASEVVNAPAVMLANKGASARMRVVLCSQTLQDYVVRLGSEAKAEQLLGNINNILCLRVQNKRTQEYLAHKLGVIELKRVAESTGEGNVPGLGTRQSVNRHLEANMVDRVPTALLGELPTLDYILLAVNGRTYKGRLPIID